MTKEAGEIVSLMKSKKGKSPDRDQDLETAVSDQPLISLYSHQSCVINFYCIIVVLRANANMIELLKDTNKDEFGLEFKKENQNRNNEQR